MNGLFCISKWKGFSVRLKIIELCKQSEMFLKNVRNGVVSGRKKNLHRVLLVSHLAGFRAQNV